MSSDLDAALFIQNAVAAAQQQDNHLALCDVRSAVGTDFGANHHPGATTQRNAAELLADLLRKQLPFLSLDNLFFSENEKIHRNRNSQFSTSFLVCMIGMSSDLDAAPFIRNVVTAAQQQDNHLALCDVRSIVGTDFGANHHPGAITQRNAAELLADLLRKHLPF